MKSNRVVFLSFADKRYNTKRIRDEAKASGFFSEVIICDEGDFEDWYFSKYQERFKERGFGYWQWKPYLILRQLQQMEEGEVLIYSDSGNTVNKNGRKCYAQYLEMLDNCESGIIVSSTGLPESSWTKGDVFDYFNADNKAEYISHTQIQAGIIFIRKSLRAYLAMSEWYYILHDKHNLSTDSFSHKPNFPDFKENRHDQSILSLLSIKYSFTELQAGEVFTNGNWEEMAEYPFWCTRNTAENSSNWKKVKRRIKHIFRFPFNS